MQNRKTPSGLQRRHVLGLGAGALCAACGGGQATPGDAFAATSVQVPMTLASGHASVEARINGQVLRLLLDTGADGHTLTPAAAQRLGLALSAQTVPNSGGAGSGPPVSWVECDEIDVGGARMRQQRAYVIPMPPEFTYDGVLGAPWFRQWVCSFAYAQGQLLLERPGRFRAPAEAVRLPLQALASGKLLVQASLGEHAGWWSVDTGAGNAVTVFTPAVERLRLRERFTPAVRMVTGISVGGLTRADVVRVPQFDLGRWRFTQVVAELSLANAGLFGAADWMGNLGAELWRRFTVTLDVAGGVMLLEPNAALAEAFAGPKAGLATQWADGAATVVEVAAGSPADRAGLRAGERIVALDGRALPSPLQWQAALRGAAGTALALTVHGADDSMREAVMVLREMV